MARLKKISIIVPRTAFNPYMFILLPNLGTIYIGTVLKEKGYDVRIFNENISKIFSWQGRLKTEILDSDAVLISVVTPTSERGYMISQLIRKSNPRTKILLGGPHITASYSDPASREICMRALDYADWVVIGECERIIDMVLKGEYPYGIVYGDWFKTSDGIEDGIVNRSEWMELDDLPIPDMSLVVGYQKTRWVRKRVQPISTSRGCPFNCSFCSVHKIAGGKYRFRSPESVIDEIRFRFGGGTDDYVFFTDDNFAASGRRAKKILEFMLTEGIDIKWTAQVRADIAEDEELVELIDNTKCSSLHIGIESVNQASLTEGQKRQSINRVTDEIRKLKEHNISVHGNFMFGFDSDDPSIFHTTVDYAIELDLLTAQFASLTPFPGTDIYKELMGENRIFNTNFSYYDGLHTVFSPRRMEPATLQEGVIWAWRNFYKRKVANTRYRLAASFLVTRFKNVTKKYRKLLRSFNFNPDVVFCKNNCL